ncbi:hypothetical protein SISSUDRAFT_975827, partial [Sistotremastrum suecicum HHB10207 ss-3]
RGVSVLAMQGCIDSPTSSPTMLRLDSGADLSLLSEDFYRTLSPLPPLRKGIKVKLWQLTSTETRILGYVQTNIFVKDMAGRLLSLEVEAYVVTGMTVPILLGEDFHENYAITVKRTLDAPTTITLGDTDHVVSSTHTSRVREAMSITKHPDATRILQLRKDPIIRAAATVTIPAFSSKSVPVVGDLGVDKSWLTERSMIHLEGGSYLIVPPSLFESSNPYVPVSNPTHLPRILHAGEVLANVDSPDD